jgi:glucose-1-phosphate thymidylyltransferase
MMKAIILAAGYATRLWPLTLDKPKPLLPVGKKPIIEHIMKRLEKINGLSEIHIVSNTKFVEAFTQWKKNYRCKKKIFVTDDGMKTLDERRGSIGDTIFTIEKRKINTDILVVAGDNLFDFDLNVFIKKARSNSQNASIGLFDIKDKKLAKEYGIASLNKNSTIASFEEKPLKPKTTLAAMCLYYFPKDKIRLLKKYKADGHPLDLAGSFIKWLSQRESVYGHVFKGRWLDIGDKKSLKKAQSIKW